MSLRAVALSCGLVAGGFVLGGCVAADSTKGAARVEPMVVPASPVRVAAAAGNMLAEWTGPYGGVPRFDWINDPVYLQAIKPAVEQGIAEHLAEIDAIADNPAPATFENTVVALEASGSSLSRALVFWRVWSASESTPEFRLVQAEVAPLLADYESAVNQNQALLKRLAAVQGSPQARHLTASEARLLKKTYDGFARNGATLSGAPGKRYAAIQKRLAELYTEFGANMLADEEGYVTYLNDKQLGGLPASIVQAAAQAASDHGRAGEWAITNTRSSMDPFLTYSTERALREKVWRNFYARGDNPGDHDNKPLIAEILKLRNERVALLGFENYAQWRLDNRMAQTPARAEALLMQLWPAAIARVEREVADMQALAEAQAAGESAPAIAGWDYRYYADKVKRSKYALDSNEVMQYLQLDNVLDAMFFVAGELFDFEFAALPEGAVPVYGADIRVWDVTRDSTGEHIGLWYLDPYARPGKGSGAWASTYRARSTFAGDKTVIVSNNSNFSKAPEGQPLLVSWDDAETLFHEFGHALHALSADVVYDSQNWGPRDYTEFHSQLLERWLLTPPVVATYLRHHETDEPMPASLVAKLRKAATFNQGFSTAQYLASALMDLKLHTTDPTGLDAAAFEKDTLAALKMPSALVMRHRTTHFGHVFESEGYAAGYYSYIWSEVLAADAAEAFESSPNGFYNKELAAKMVNYLFAPRDSIDPMAAYREFRGREPDVKALVRDRGLDE